MTGDSDAARPVTSAEADLLVGVDVGGSKVAVLVVDRDFTIRGRHAVPTAAGAPDEAAPHIATAVAAALVAADADLSRVAAVGVGVPGRIDPVAGVVLLAVNLGWRWLPLRDRLEALLGVPCAIENDVRAVAAGILERRVLGDVADFVYLSVGTGIGAGVVLDGRLHRGTRGLAGEIGHIVVDPDGALCRCGLRGCLETIAAGPGIARAAAEALATGRRSSLAGRAEITATDVYAAAAAGDLLACGVVDWAGRALAWAIHGLVMTYDVERILLGGGVAAAGNGFLDPVLAELAVIRGESELAAGMLPADIVAIWSDGGDAGSWGGVSIARVLGSMGESVGHAVPEAGSRHDGGIGTAG